MMKVTAVVSSNVTSVGYDSDVKTLQVEFKNGDTYHYFDVPPDVFERFVTAESAGQFLSKEIKGNYHYKKVT